MPIDITLRLNPRQASDQAVYLPIAARKAGLQMSQVAFTSVLKRSIDARSKSVKIELTLRLFKDTEQQPGPVNFDYPDVSNSPEVAIVGSGPAGLFAALRLIERGLRPVILERGNQVSARKRDIARINRGQGVPADSNYAFGEGGAGTFSDGKLYTRSKKRGDYDKALRTLVFHGAHPAILYDARPHIGTDRLPGVISRIRETITTAGGRIIFGARFSGITIKDDTVSGLEWQYVDAEHARGSTEKIEAKHVIIAAGHSARDVYGILYSRGIRLEAKPFAMGLRIEHPQALIDSIQYHTEDRGEYLPAASYSLVSQVGGRGVYSFCMCPGGFIVPAMTDEDQSVVNGMSPSGRNSPFANSGIVTEVRLSDFEHLRKDYGELAGMEFQARLERAARKAAGDGQKAPAQRIADFVNSRRSADLPKSSYVPGTIPTRFSEWMPRFMADSLSEGIASFGRKMKGFVTNEGLLLGVESRTSTPVRIPRDPNTLEHPEIKGLYPSGEGAGYAGGIISAALDGEKVADMVADNIRKK